MADITRVADVFVDKNIFITGGTGFIGKVLIEKLLRSCPGVNKVYILLRPRRDKTITARLQDISKLPLFEKLHSEKPGHFQTKVIPVNGDVALPQLGLSSDDHQMLVENVNIVYHVAASVRFDQALSDAILLNIRGTREVCSLVLEMHRCDLMVHVSTAYAHTQYNPIEERMYPATTDWRQCINAAEKLNRYDMSKLQAIIMGPFPNTYTYTKGVAEWVVHDMLNGKVANLIIRPSIIVSSLRDPFPGWIDNFNGPLGMIIAIGTGLIRISLLKQVVNDMLPVDIAVRTFLNITWYRLSQPHGYGEKSISVHNCSSNTYHTTNAVELLNVGINIAIETPFSACVWYPSKRYTGNFTVFSTLFILLQVLPALFLDMLLRLLNYKPIVLNIQRRIYVAINALKFFLFRAWTIQHSSLFDLEFKISSADVEDFAYELKFLNLEEYYRNAGLGARKYLLKEDVTKLKQNRRRMQFLRYLDLVVTTLFFAFMSYLLLIKWNVPQLAFSYIGNYFDSLETPFSF